MGGSKENKKPAGTKQLNSDQGKIKIYVFPSRSLKNDEGFESPVKKNNRRALSNINQNILGPERCPYRVNKRGFSEKVTGQSRSNHRSVFPEEKNEEPKPTTLNHLKGIGDCPAIGMEECELASDEPTPMFVKHTEAVLDESDELVEVEMEDVEEDPVLDIDSRDVKDPTAVVEYIESIHAHYRRSEDSGRVSPNYMMGQFNINAKMRAILIEWLIEVHYKFKLQEETLFLTVNLIDRFLERETVVREELQLVGVTALLLACKYEEISVPVVDDLISISDHQPCGL